MPPLVVLDTNAWVSTRMLTSPEACEFLAHCRQTGRRILFPEIVEGEVQAQYLKALTECAQQISVHNDTLISLIGRWDVLRVPTSNEMQAAIDSRLKALDALIERSPLTVEQSRDALSRTIHRHPPASPNGEQYRDCLLWAALMSHANPTIELVTNDNTFFEKKDNTLHPALLREADDAGRTVKVHRHLSGLLKALVEDPATQQATLFSRALVAAYASGAVSGAGHRLGLEVVQFQNVPDVQLFATEDPHRLMAEFSATVPVQRALSIGVSTISIRGSVYVRTSGPDVLQPEFEDARMLDELTVRDLDGEPIQALSAAGVSAKLVAGDLVREHRVRRPIAGAPLKDLLAIPKRE